MRDATIARNYAETLLELARREKALDAFGALIADVADALDRDATLRHFMDSPRVSVAQRNAVLEKAYAKRAPRAFLRFMQAVVNHRRQMLFRAIAIEYAALVDEAEGRVHAQVTVARETPDAERDLIARELSRSLGKKVVPHLRVDPAIIGGVVVKVGDTVMDGSVRKRLAVLRSRLVGVR